MNVGIDIGYKDVKVWAGPKRYFSFSSVVGTPQTTRFSMNGNEDILIERDGKLQVIGEGALKSRFYSRPEDRDWLEKLVYDYLVDAAFSELTTASVDLVVVSGLPVAFYNMDAEKMKQKFLGEHQINRQGRHQQTFKVRQCKILMQGVGVALSEVMDNGGGFENLDLAKSALGIIDVGGKTTNLISMKNLSENPEETTSIEVGGWDVVRELENYIDDNYSGLGLKDHQIAEVGQTGRLDYFDKTIDLSQVVADIAEPMANQIINSAGQRWNGGQKMKRIFLAGGGALLIGQRLREHFKHAVIVKNPVFANAIGYWKYAQFLAKRG